MLSFTQTGRAAMAEIFVDTTDRAPGRSKGGGNLGKRACILAGPDVCHADGLEGRTRVTQEAPSPDTLRDLDYVITCTDASVRVW